MKYIGISYKYYMLGLLVVAGVATSFERFIFALVLEPIKHELQLSDSQLGLMTGIAFAGFYAVAGIPIARWADRGNRVNIAALAVGLLGITVSLCGLAGGFIQLLMARAGIAVGEAGIVPPGQSLIADYFDRSERPRAMAIFTSFFSISMIVGYLLGGQLVEAYGWRMTFIIMGLPSLFIALIVKLTLREPRLKHSMRMTNEAPSLLDTLRFIFIQPSLRQLFMAFCVAYFFSAGTSQWLATFYIRTHGMTSSEVGTWLALTFGLFSIVGVISGGYFVSRYLACQERSQMRLLAVSAVLAYGVLTAAAYLVTDKTSSLLCLSVSAFIGGLANGPFFASIQSLVTEQMRSTGLAVIFLFSNLIGFGLAPLLLGALSDLLNPSMGQDSLRYALVLFCPGSLWVAFHYWKASNTIEDDIGTIAHEEKVLAGNRLNIDKIQLNHDSAV